jgi:hypothetical protein
MRAIFTSSALGMTQPMITSSNASGSKGWRNNKDRPTATAKFAAGNGPGGPFDLRKGVRNPSTTKTARRPLDFATEAMMLSP